MYSWQYNEKILKEYITNHSKDFGRFYCELMLTYPKHYKEFLDGFYEEYVKRMNDDNKT